MTGAMLMTYSGTCDSPLGTLRLIAQNNSLTGLIIDGDPSSARTGPLDEDQPVFAAVRAWLAAYFDRKNPSAADLPLAPAGTPFQQEVWAMLCKIPYGTTRTYGELAQEIAVRRNIPRMASQAVGGAVGRNPIGIIIPCHRVVGANGNLTGYGGGLHHKVSLLALEGVDMSGFYMPRHASDT